MLGERYQLWSAFDSAAASQVKSLWEPVSVLRMAFSHPQVEAAAPQLVTTLKSGQPEFQEPEKTSDWQPAVQILQQQLQPGSTQTTPPTTASLSPYEHDACDKKQQYAMPEWSEFPPVRQAMPAM